MATVETKINIKLGDVSGLQGVDRFSTALEDARKQVAELRNSSRAGLIETSQFDDAITKLGSIDAQLISTQRQLLETRIKLQELDPASDAFDETRLKAARLEEQLASLARQASAVPDALDQAAQRPTQRLTEAQGDISTTFSGFAGLAGGLGASPQVGGGLQLVGDIAGVAEYLPRFGQGIQTMSQSLQASGGVIGTIATTAATAAAPLGATAAGLAGIVAVAAPVALAVAAVAVAVGQVNQLFGDLRANSEAMVAATSRRVATERDFLELYDTGDLDTAQSRYEEALRTIERSNAQLAEQQALQAETNRQYAELGASFNPLVRAAFGQVGQTIEEEIRRIENDPALAQAQADVATFEQTAAQREAARVAQEQIETIRLRTQAERELTNLLASGGADALAQRREQIEAEIAARESEIAQLEALGDTTGQAAERIEALRTEIEGLSTQRDVFAGASDVPGGPVVDPAAQQAAIDAIEQRAQAELQLAQLVRDGTTEQINARREMLRIELQILQQQRRELEALASTSEAAQDALDQVNASIARTSSEAQVLERAAPQVAAREREQAAAEVETAEVESAQRIRDIRAASLEQLAQIEANAAKARQTAAANRDSGLVAAETKAREAVAKVNADYMKSERAAFAKFRDDETKATRDYNRDRVRLLEDLNNELLDAEENNDVASFIAAKRRGEQELRRQEEDAQSATDERVEQFLQEREAATVAHQERLTQIEEQRAADRASVQARFDDQIKAADEAAKVQTTNAQKQLDERLKAEQTALQRTIQQINERYRTEVSAASRAAQDVARAQVNAAQGAINAISSLAQALVNQVRSSAQSAARTTTNSSGDSNSTQRRGQVRAFAAGGIIPAGRETFAYFEPDRNYAEAVIPLTRAGIEALLPTDLLNRGSGQQMAMPSAPVVNFSGDFTVGDGVSVGEVQQALRSFAGEIVQGLQLARNGGGA